MKIKFLHHEGTTPARAGGAREPQRKKGSPTSVLALDIRFTADALIVALSDGQEICVPLEWFPRLRDATPKQRKNWRLIAKGIGIHWKDVDEDISVASLLCA